ncbi:MAG: hypothetical protein RLZZ367_207 [Bacteroidota bacterium]|jgi:hypothetical protein
MNLSRVPLTLFAILLSVSFLFAGNSSYYVNTDNDTIWGTGIWPKVGFDAQRSIMFVDADSNLLELNPDTIQFVVIEKSGHREVFKSTKTDIWGRLFLHQVIVGNVTVLWGYDFNGGSVLPTNSWNNRGLSGGPLPSISPSHDNISRALMTDPYPTYNGGGISVSSIMYYLQKDGGKVTHLYDITFKRQMSKFFADNEDVIKKLHNGDLKYSGMESFLATYDYSYKEKDRF